MVGGKGGCGRCGVGKRRNSLKRVEFEALATSTSSHKDGVEDRW